MHSEASEYNSRKSHTVLIEQKLRLEYITCEGRSTVHVQKKKRKKSDYIIFKCLLWIEQNTLSYMQPCHDMEFTLKAE